MDFGDETTTTGQTVFHIYLKAGVYNVALTARDAAGNTNKTFVTVIAILSTSPWQMSIFIAFVAIFGMSTTLIISLRKRKQIIE